MAKEERTTYAGETILAGNWKLRFSGGQLFGEDQLGRPVRFSRPKGQPRTIVLNTDPENLDISGASCLS